MIMTCETDQTTGDLFKIECWCWW